MNSASTLGGGNVQICTLPSSPCNFIQTKNETDDDKLISGTYCHPDLIPHIACWISPDLALKVSKIVNAYITQEYKIKLSEMQFQLEQTTEECEATKTAAQLTHQQVNKLETNLKKKERRHQVWSSSHAFTMLRLNNPIAKHHYYAIRRKRVNMSGAIKKLRAKHPHSIMVFQTSYVPNPVNLYNRLKTCGILKFKGNYCNSVVPESELITKMGELYDIVE
jgi:hypothetical protein